ncbi:MAG: PilZ domain-containing protein [Candidatus Acidiferrales bacterium]
MSTQPTVPASKSVSWNRSERRISVHLPVKLRRRDQRGVTSEENTSSENLCRSGAAFVTRFDVAIGSELEIYIPFYHHTSRRREAAFETHGIVVYVVDAPSKGERLVGVQFTGPRFQRVFRSESTA